MATFVIFAPSSVFILLCNSVENHCFFQGWKKKAETEVSAHFPLIVWTAAETPLGAIKIPNRMGTDVAISFDPVNSDFSGLAPTHLTGKNPAGVFCWMDHRPKGPWKALGEELARLQGRSTSDLILTFTTQSVFYTTSMESLSGSSSTFSSLFQILTYNLLASSSKSHPQPHIQADPQSTNNQPHCQIRATNS